MLPPKEEKIFEELRDLAKKHDVVILSAKSNTKRFSHLSMADHVISISRSTQNSNAQSLTVTKARYQCPIRELIDNQDKKGLETYLNNIDNNTFQNVMYRNPLLVNCIYLLEKKSYEYIEIIENSKIFKNYVTDLNDFWIRVGFEVDDYEFLTKKVSLKEIIEHKNLQKHIATYIPTNSLNKLLEIEKFVNIVEKDFNLLDFIQIQRLSDNKKYKVLANILNKISVKEKYIDFDSLFEQFHDLHKVYDIENNKYFFNVGLKVFIINSDYVFKDKNIECLSEDNKILIDNKILNINLNNNLPLKMNVKKPKI